MDTSFVSSLSEYNTAINSACIAARSASTHCPPTPTSVLPVHCRHVWLWYLDPTEECTVTTPLNTCHLVGLLLARDTWLGCCLQETPNCASHNFNCASHNFIPQKSVSQYSLRDLRNCIQHMQAHWAQCGMVKDSNTPSTLHALFKRFGELSMTESTLTELMNDQGSVQESHSGEDKVMMNSICIKRFLNVFLAMFRQLDIVSRCETLQDVEGNSQFLESQIRKHHVYAGVDDFHILSMHWDLMVGAKLVYMHDFSGMYNCVSQVVYFHNAEYQRRSVCLEPVELVAAGEAGTEFHSLYTLPAMLQLYPEITVVHDDTDCPFDSKWHWLMMCREIYLVSPTNDIFYDRNIVKLLQVYLRESVTTK